MVNLVRVDFPPKVVCFGYLIEEEKECLIVSNSANGKILILDEDGYALESTNNREQDDFDNVIEKMEEEVREKSK
jgi:hypothetical protein